MISYEDRLSANLEWALTEGSIFFEDRGAVQTALRRIAKRLDELAIPYAVAGGMALFAHGVRRFTEDVDILLTPESLKRVHEELEGRGYTVPFTRSKNLRDTEHGVRVEFLVSGQFPGDGKPKPVSFPKPDNVFVEIDGIRVLSLSKLIELKLASGVSSPHRGKDLVDVQDLISTRNLPLDFGLQLDPYVRQKYQELWHIARSGAQRYLKVWQDGISASDSSGLTDLVTELRNQNDMLEAMLADGVQVDQSTSLRAKALVLFTSDEEVARKYNMHPEEEHLLGG